MQVQEVKEDEKGSGYELATTTVTLTGGGGSGAQVHASKVNDQGGITEYAVDSPGTGYTSAPTVAISSPTGSGAAAEAKVGD